MPQLFVNRLTIMDFAYLHPERGLLGESWLVDVELEGSLNEQAMVLDFGLVKKQIKRLIDREFDHRLLVPAYSPHCEVNESANYTSVHFRFGNHRHLLHRSPAEAVCCIPASEITLDTVARAIHDRISLELPDNIHGCTIRLYAELSEGAFYHYSHGLKYHEGNCRRIAHGHRSQLRIQRDGERDPELEWSWAERWHDIYIASREDLLKEMHEGHEHYYFFGYQTSSGEFGLELPAASCYLIDGDTTVENLAQHIADQLLLQQPGHNYHVTAYEGVDKGAVGLAGYRV